MWKIAMTDASRTRGTAEPQVTLREQVDVMYFKTC
jgi:hypothetical protein